MWAGAVVLGPVGQLYAATIGGKKKSKARPQEAASGGRRMMTGGATLLAAALVLGLAYAATHGATELNAEARQLAATVEGKTLPDTPLPYVSTFEIVATYPHSPSAFTQGLSFDECAPPLLRRSTAHTPPTTPTYTHTHTAARAPCRCARPPVTGSRP